MPIKQIVYRISFRDRYTGILQPVSGLHSPQADSVLNGTEHQMGGFHNEDKCHTPCPQHKKSGVLLSAPARTQNTFLF